MKKFLIIFLILFLQSCSKPKSVFICGDHVCINKEEANQYFEKKLSIEIKIIDNKKRKENIDLVELNLRKNNKNKKIISVKNKIYSDTNVKKLTKKEIKEIKSKLKNKKIKKIAKKNVTKKIENKQLNKTIIEDVCTIVKKCSIDEISKHLIKIGKKKDFPDITSRE
tara:strand:+ start:497 stop:997 length:501 start_codon:yes stop_codon:yes gene_type:complete